MKKFNIFKNKMFLQIILLIAVVFAILDYPSYAQKIYSDDKLFEEGYKFYNRDDFIQAAIYLFAYVQREPSRFRTDAKHKIQVLESLAYAKGDRYKSAGVSGDYYRKDLKPKPMLDKPRAMPKTGGTQRSVKPKNKQQIKAYNESEYYVLSRYKPKQIPVDLESWLNGRKRGFGLVAVNRDVKSGNFNSFFKKLGKRVTPWKYKVVITPESQMKKRLDSYSRQGMRLLAVTNIEGGVTGLRYICFFRKTQTPPPPTLR